MREHPPWGFALLELVLWVAIASVVVGFALPSFTDLARASDAEKIKSDLFTIFSFARAEAINRQQLVTACPLNGVGACVPGWHGMVSVFADVNRNAKREPEEPLLRSVAVDLEHWTLSVRPASRHYFQWNPLGISNGTAGSVEICKPDWPRGGRAVVVSFGGRIRTSHDFDGNGVQERSPGAPVSC